MRAHPSLLLLLLACNEQDFNKVDGPEDGGGPQIEVTPTLLDFGTVGADDEAVVRSFTIKSVGTDTLHIEGITLDGENTGFTILTDVTSFPLDPDETLDVDVAFQAMGSTNEAQALVASDDPEDEVVPVDLTGFAAVPELQIDPDPLDMGETYIGCHKDNEIELSNVGTSTLTISNIEYEGGAEFTLNTGYSLPMDLEPGEATILDLTFTPTDEASFAATLSVTSNEPLGTRVATQTGAGHFGASYEDEFVVPEDPASDIMFIVDQSCSMDDDALAVAENFNEFITALDTYTSDWQLIVANNDRGCNTTGILTESTPGYESTFTSEAQDGSGTYIVDTEALLIPAAAGVEATDSGECNAGFLREDALLHIILVSDEPEQSGGWTGGSEWEDLTNQIIAKKGSDTYTRISAIAGDVPGGCSSRGNSAEPGTGYYEAVEATGGIFLSLCSDWGAHVDDLAAASINQDTFELDNTPYEPSIEVFVNGSPRTSGWTYDATQNAVVFDDPVPEGGDTVLITYGGSVDCD